MFLTSSYIIGGFNLVFKLMEVNVIVVKPKFAMLRTCSKTEAAKYPCIVYLNINIIRTNRTTKILQ